MFLKRILTAALGALGLGAFAAGTASAQQIPAPDIFDDQITCSMNVPSAMNTPMPSVIPMGATMSPLDTLIGDGMTAIDVTGTGAGSYEDLGYVIPADGSNCGLGMGSDPFVATGMNAMGEAAEGAIPFDVADGYSTLLTRFMAVYGDPGDAASTGAKGVLDAANEALAMGIAMGTTGAALTALNEAVTRAEEAYTKALAAFNAVSTDPTNSSSLGPIYDAGKAEWMAKATVTKAVVEYNSQVATTTTAQTTLDAMNYADNYVEGATPDAADSLWVPLGNTELFAGSTPVVTIAMGMGTVNIGQLVQYTNADLANPQVGMAAVPGMGTGDGSAGNDAPVASDVTASNFDAAGNLIVPMEANTATADDGTDLRNTTSATNAISDIRTLVENANIAAAALKKARDDNVGLNQAIYDEAYRRAQAEADYYNARWTEVLAYSRDTRTDLQKLEYLDTDGSGVNEAAERTEGNRNTAYVANPTSIASRNADLTTEQNKRFLREQELRTAVTAREMATDAVRTAFTDPQDFYNQLVAKRNAAKIAADKAVAGATTPTLTQTTAQENAMKALVEANGRKATIDSLFDDPNDPTEALVTELLKGDDDGDDGQALVNAISSNYDAVNALTAEDDPATLEDESGRITQLEDKVEMLSGGEDGTSGLGALEDKVNALTAMDDPETMEDETGAVTKNANEITGLDKRVADNEADLDTVWADYFGEPRDVEAQHDDAAVCTGTGTKDIALCADARSRHNEEDLENLMADDGPIQGNADAIAALTDVAGVAGATEDGAITAALKAGAKAATDADMKLAMDLGGEGRTTETIMGNATDIDALEGRMDTAEGDIDMAEMDIDALEGRMDTAEGDIDMAEMDIDALEGRMDTAEGDIDMAEMDIDALEGRMDTAEGDIDMAEMDIDALEGRMDTAEGDIDMAEMDIDALEGRMDTAEGDIDMAEMDIDALEGRMDTAEGDIDMAEMDIDMAEMDIDALEGRMMTAETDIDDNTTAISTETTNRTNADMSIRSDFASADSMLRSDLTGMINSNTSMINDNRRMIGELSDDLDVVRAGVAASMALAGMPAINGRGIAIGVGSYDGESAFAVGFQIQGEQASFKIGVTSSGGETGASAGVGFNF